MKTQFLRPLFIAALAAVFAGSHPLSLAQDEKKEDAPKEEKKEDAPQPDKEKEKEKQGDDEAEDDGDDEEEARPELDVEELKRRSQEEQKARDADVRKMLTVFKPLEGEWTGEEKIEHREERFKPFDKAWKDTWRGFYTVDGRYFEMTGQTEGDEKTSYRWVCTWDSRDEAYKAWYFGETSQTVYTGELSKDSKYVIWSVEDEETDTETKFSMIADGDRVKCSGTDRSGGRIVSRQSSNYTRKRVEL